LDVPARVIALNLHLATAAGEVRVALYQDNAGNPGTLVVQSAPQAAVTGWNVLDVADVDLSAGSYWLAFQTQSGCAPSFSAGAAGSEAYVTRAWGTFPSTFPVCLKNGNLWDINASICPLEARPSLTPTPTFTPTLTSTRTPTFTFSPTPTITPTWSPAPARCTNPTFLGVTDARFAEGMEFPMQFVGATRFSLNKDSWAIRLSVHLRYGDGRVQMALYSDEGSFPGTLLITSGIAESADGWNDLEIPDTLLYAGHYWIAFQTDGYPDVSTLDDATTNAAQVWEQFGTFPAVFTLGSDPLEGQFSRLPCVHAGLCPLEPGTYATATLTLTPTFTMTPTITPTFTPTPTGWCANPSHLGPDLSQFGNELDPFTRMIIEDNDLTFDNGTFVNHYHLSASGYAQSLRFVAWETGPSARIQAAVYQDAGGYPGDLLLQSEVVMPPSASPEEPAFFEIPLPATYLPTGHYWVAVQVYHCAGIYLGDTYFLPGPFPQATDNSETSGFPSTFWPGSLSEDRQYYFDLLYCPVYPTATSTATPTVTPTVGSPTATPTVTPTLECTGSGSFGSARNGLTNPDPASFVRANRYHLTDLAILESFYLSILDSSGGSFSGAIYDQNFDLVAETAPQSVPEGSSGIQTAFFAGEVLQPGDYWLAFKTQGVDAAYNEMSDTEGFRLGQGTFFPGSLLVEDEFIGEPMPEEYGASVSYCRVYLSPTPTGTPTETPTVTMTPTITLTPTVTATPYCEYTPLADLTGFLGGTPVPGDTSGATNEFRHGGYGFNSPDDLFTFTLTEPHTVTASLCRSSFDTTMYLRNVCSGDDTTLVFNDDSNECASNPSGSKFRILLGPGFYYLIVDGYTNTSDAGPYTLTLRDDRPWPDADGDGYPEDVDCDDANGNVHPGAAEVCGNGVDEDCNGSVDDRTAWLYVDEDGDGYTMGEWGEWDCSDGPPPRGTTEDDLGPDCDDWNDQVHPGAPEICDGMDNDCDGETDEGAGNVYYADWDHDGYGRPDISESFCFEPPSDYVPDNTDFNDDCAECYPGAPEICDGLDNDGNGQADEDLVSDWYLDQDGDGYGDDNYNVYECRPGPDWVAAGGDCGPYDSSIHPGAVEVCDGADNNCDGNVDEGLGQTWYHDGDGDGYGDPLDSTVACFQPPQYVDNSLDCNDDCPICYPGMTEVCDGADNDCDGDVDEGMTTTYYPDADGDGYGNPALPAQACDRPDGHVGNDLDCDDDHWNCYPNAPEYCDTLDNDCDGETDEEAVDAVTWYEDSDGDGYGNGAVRITSCSQPDGYVDNFDDCDDACATCHPGGTEVCDGADNDCINGIDEVGCSATPTATPTITPPFTPTPTETPYCTPTPVGFGGAPDSPTPIAGFWISTLVQVTAPSVLTGMRAYCLGTTSQIRMALYDQTGPLIASTLPQAIVPGWNHIDIPDQVIPASIYNLVVQTSNPSDLLMLGNTAAMPLFITYTPWGDFPPVHHYDHTEFVPLPLMEIEVCAP
jgi:hypothetical protein